MIYKALVHRNRLDEAEDVYEGTERLYVLDPTYVNRNSVKDNRILCLGRIIVCIKEED